MTYKEILVLLNAGYTKDEISAMDLPDNQQVPQQPSSANDVAAAGVSSLLSSPAAPPVPSPSAGEEEVVPASSSPAMEPDPMGQLQSMIQGLMTQLQQNNRAQADMGARIIDPHENAINTLRSLNSIPNNQE